jgi:peptidoglycan/LPS O-acetylase OafA/YrhL
MATNDLNPHRSGLRGEIQGLRAIAVVLVMLFHAGVTGFSAGYVGVDIFFVISGFIIIISTTITFIFIFMTKCNSRINLICY